jgi:hypothetical protein
LDGIFFYDGVGAQFGAPALECADQRKSLSAGVGVVIDPVLEAIIDQLRSCIINARALKLDMLEHILSIALLEAYDARGKYGNGQDGAQP